MARNEYIVSVGSYSFFSSNPEIHSCKKQDIYDMWQVRVMDNKDCIPGCDGYCDCFTFDNEWSRTQFIQDEGYEYMENHFESVDGMRHKIGDSTFYDEPCQVDLHIYYVYKK